MNAEKIVKMLLGGDNNSVRGVIVDEDVITYLSELEDGYEDHDLPVIAVYDNVDSDEPSFECSMNELENAEISMGFYGVCITVKTEAYGTTTIQPLVGLPEIN